MARTTLSLEHAATYQRALLDLRSNVAHLLQDSWAKLDQVPDDRALSAWCQYASQVLTEFQRRAVRIAPAYLAAVETAELRERVAAAAIDVNRYAGSTRGGVPLLRALSNVTARTLRAAQVAGHRPADASRMALAAAQRTAAYEMISTPGQALSDLMRADRRVLGWRRVMSATPCGACLAAADGTIHPPSEEMERHPHDRCVEEIVLAGVPDLHRPQTGQELFNTLSRADQDALFRNRGGADKAELIRSGQVPLHALLTRAPRGPLRPDVISETPLRALAA